MDSKELTVEEKIVQMLKTVYDPEIPVNVFDLGLIYKVDVEDGNVKIDMTLTAPNCPAADFIVEDVRMKVESIARGKKCGYTVGLRARMGQRYDERRSQT